MKQLILLTITALLWIATIPKLAAESGGKHQHNGTQAPHDAGPLPEPDRANRNEHAQGESEVTISAVQAELAKIKVAPLIARVIDYQVYAPAEIRANGYTSYQVSPRVDSVVLRRHVALGDHVKRGRLLVTLFSEAVSEAQAAYLVAQSEWRRVEKLGRKTVGERRFVEAQTDYAAATGKLSAFGLTAEAIAQLSRNAGPLGEYSLTAATDGAVLADNFQQGQRLEAGEALLEIADEQALWVEARLPASTRLALPKGSEALVQVDGEIFNARVSQEAHTIDPVTRTRTVRLLVDNNRHRLHPGMFADVYFSFRTPTPVLAVPESALMRGPDGDWALYVAEPSGRFRAQEITLGRSLGGQREISGIAAGTKIVIEGAFFVASEITKGGFDPHNH